MSVASLESTSKMKCSVLLCHLFCAYILRIGGGIEYVTIYVLLSCNTTSQKGMILTKNAVVKTWYDKLTCNCKSIGPGCYIGVLSISEPVILLVVTVSMVNKCSMLL